MKIVVIIGYDDLDVNVPQFSPTGTAVSYQMLNLPELNPINVIDRMSKAIADQVAEIKEDHTCNDCQTIDGHRPMCPQVVGQFHIGEAAI